MKSLPRFDVEAMRSEFVRAKLPDERLVARLDVVVELLSADPSASFAQIACSEADREALYRFVRNQSASASASPGAGVGAGAGPMCQGSCRLGC
jgi:hypothetical protein